MPATTQNFAGISNFEQFDTLGFFSNVPDTNGDVGPNHYVQWVNKSFSIYSKDGTKLQGPVAGKQLWTGFGGLCETSNDGDPIVQYDHLADRWVMTQFAYNGRDANNKPAPPYFQCVAVSRTPDPLGQWYLYSWASTATFDELPKFNDYGKLGLWPDGYYLTLNQFINRANGTTDVAGQGLVVFEREAMLAGDPDAGILYWDFSPTAFPTYFSMLPGDLDGPAPPAGTANVVARFYDGAWGAHPDSILVSRVTVDWVAPLLSLFHAPTVVSVSAFDSNLCNWDQSCIAQAGTTNRVDALADRLMWRLQHRYRGSHQSLVLNHTVDVGSDQAGVRWYELRDGGGGWFVFQEGTHAPDEHSRWMGSAAMDDDGNIAIGYSVSSSTLAPSIRYAGRLATDPAGTLPQAESSIAVGAGAQTVGNTRWGDYSSMSIDPDGCTFWYTTEYYTFDSVNSWSTRIASFSFPSCVPAPQNDAFSTSIVLGGASGTTSGTNVGATKETGEPNHAGNTGGKSVWYRWTAPADGTLTVTTAGSTDPGAATLDTLLAVYRGSAVNLLTLPGLTWQNDDGGPGLTSTVGPVPVTEGTTYRIAVDGFTEAGNPALAKDGSISLAWTFSPDRRAPADFDADGDTDIGFYRPSNGVWVLRGQDWVHFPAQASDVLVPGDYDGDGDTDIAFYRPSSGVWVIRGQDWVHFPAQASDILLPADYDGDGDTDLAFYRPSTGVWVIRGQPWVHFPAQAGDVLQPRDYDGDGDADLAFYRPSTGVWVIRGQDWVHFPAQPSDVLLPADYDGDGDADLAFYRPGTGVWVIRGQEWVHFPAQAADVLLPADYDGDGDADLAFYRPSTGVWVIRGQEWAHYPGLAEDIPLPLLPARSAVVGS